MHVVKITDGLGNQMFQYAFARKLQLLTKQQVYLDTRFINHEDVISKGETPHFIRNCDNRMYGLDKFHTMLPIADEKVLARWKYLDSTSNKDFFSMTVKRNIGFWKYKRENEEKTIRYENVLFPTYFEGFYFDEEYYHDIRNVLQKDFSVLNPIKLPIYLSEILRKSNTVSIHVRKGDFVKLSRDITKRPYYQKAVGWIEKNISNPKYLIFSDDIQWVKENLLIKDDKIYVSELGFSDYEEMTIMKHCKHNIIANSTFSYWAAYLNSNKDKIVIYPQNWRNTIIPSGWIGF